MIKNKYNNITKKNLSKKIFQKTGLPNSYINEIIDDLLYILKTLIKEKNLNIKNFATFKTITKKEIELHAAKVTEISAFIEKLVEALKKVGQ